MIALPRPAKGTARAEKLAERAKLDFIEKTAKRCSKVRDGHRCRFPGCTTNLRQWRLESAHIWTKGMGGDHGFYSADQKHFVSLCFLHHQGARSIHSGDLRMVMGSERLGDGPVLFEELTERGWVAVGVSTP